MDGLDAATDRFLRALAHSLQPLGDLLGGRRGGVHRALGRFRPARGVGVHLREDLVHLRKPCLVALGGLGNRVRREDGGEGFPAVAQLLNRLDQHLDHEDARLADDLEFLRQPSPDLPADQERAQHGERRLEHADAGYGGRHRQIRRRPRRSGGAGGCDGRRTGGLPRRDQRRDQAVDQHGQPDFGDALEPLHHRVEVVGKKGQRLGQLLGQARRFIDPVDPLPEGIAQALEGLAHRLRQLGVLAGQLVLLAHERVDHHVSSQAAFFGQLAQPPDGHIQTIGQGLRQTGAVLDDGVEFLSPQHPGGERLPELQQGRLRLGGRCARQAQCLRDALGDRERVLLLATQHPHGLLELAVQGGRFLNRHANALGDVEKGRLRGGELTLARRRQLQARGHHVPGVGDLNDILHLASDPADRQEGQQLRLGRPHLIAEG